MKAYVMTTGVLFAALTLVHIWRAVAAEPHLAKDPWYILITAASAVLSIWAGLLLRRRTRS